MEMYEKLCEKVQNELSEYRLKLLNGPKEVILARAYNYSVWCNIAYYIENNEDAFDEIECAEMVGVDNLMEALVFYYLDGDAEYMEVIGNAIRGYVYKKIREKFIEAKRGRLKFISF